MSGPRNQADSQPGPAIANPEKCAAVILRSTPLRPSFAVLLGSGFDGMRDVVESGVELPYETLPGFLAARVDGHRGQLVIGIVEGIPVLLLCGRSHYYEGHSPAALGFPIRVLAACGISTLLLTNAAGGINRKYRPGDFMCVRDHINFTGVNPLRGCMVADGSRTCFVDLSQTYDPFLNKLLAKSARQARVRLHSGVYAAVAGPCYETPAEIRAFARLGADAVGMSLAPEAIVAKQCGLRLAAVSCITNPAAGRGSNAISHAEVLAVGDRVKKQAAALLTGFIRLRAATLGGPG